MKKSPFSAALNTTILSLLKLYVFSGRIWEGGEAGGGFFLSHRQMNPRNHTADGTTCQFDGGNVQWQ